MKHRIVIIFLLVVFALPLAGQRPQSGASRGGGNNSSSGHNHSGHLNLAPSKAWGLIPPLGLHKEETIDTLMLNYSRQSVPGEVTDAWATTGNLGAEGIDMLFQGRQPLSDFFFRDALSHWYPRESTFRFYNTRQPMTLLSFNFGGRDNAQERLKGTFSGNINSKAQLGANIDYLYSKGSYNNQAVKDLTWGFNGSYMGDRYEFQGYYNHYNLLNMENGGITDPLYITDPAELQGGVSSIMPKSIPTNLSDALTRVVGADLYINNRYKIGFWHEEHGDSINPDSVTSRTYVPVTSFIHTLRFKSNRHNFTDGRPSETRDFFANTYLNSDGTDDNTSYWSLSNTLGISLLEGFQKWAKFGLAGYATFEHRRYKQTPDTFGLQLDPWPAGTEGIADEASQNLLWVGGQLTKQRGNILRYEATAEFGLIGAAAGELRLDGAVHTLIPLGFINDSINVSAFGSFHNESTPYLINNYRSNHFIWKNDFGKERRVNFGGELSFPRTATHVKVAVDNIQNMLYFGPDFLPRQYSGNIQVFSASLRQNLRAGILHWDNSVTYQTSSNGSVLPLPTLTVYSNLYLLFNIATLKVQFGVDCDYYTSYRALLYNPATANFAVQEDTPAAVKVGNYPFCNAYVNMKLKRARFYVMFSHVNQGLFGGSNYFSAVNYPLNPRRFQMGISVDFAN